MLDKDCIYYYRFLNCYIKQVLGCCKGPDVQVSPNFVCCNFENAPDVIQFQVCWSHTNPVEGGSGRCFVSQKCLKLSIKNEWSFEKKVWNTQPVLYVLHHQNPSKYQLVANW